MAGCTGWSGPWWPSSAEGAVSSPRGLPGQRELCRPLVAFLGGGSCAVQRRSGRARWAVHSADGCADVHAAWGGLHQEVSHDETPSRWSGGGSMRSGRGTGYRDMNILLVGKPPGIIHGAKVAPTLLSS